MHDKYSKATEHGKDAAAHCLAILDHKAELSPWGRNWNRDMSENEKTFWLQAADQPVKCRRLLWGALPPQTQYHLYRVWKKCAERSKFIIENIQAPH